MSSAKPDTSTPAKPARRLIGRGIVPADERVIFDRRPSLWLVLLNAGPAIASILAVALVLGLGISWLGRGVGTFWGFASDAGHGAAATMWIVRGAVVLGVMVLGWALLDWFCRRYVLTDRRAIVVFGVLHQRAADLGLGRVQNVAVSKPLIPRLLGLGHVGLATAGTDAFEVVWRAISRPDECARHVRELIDQSGERA